MIWKIFLCICLYSFKPYSNANPIGINLTSYRFCSHPDIRISYPPRNLGTIATYYNVMAHKMRFPVIFPNNHYRKLCIQHKEFRVRKSKELQKWKSQATEENTMANWYPNGERWTTLTKPCRCRRLKRLKRCARKKK